MICKYFLVKSHEEKEEIWPKVANRYSELTGENVDRQDLRQAFKTFARVAHTRDKAFQREVAETGGGTNKEPGIYHVQFRLLLAYSSCVFVWTPFLKENSDLSAFPFPMLRRGL